MMSQNGMSCTELAEKESMAGVWYPSPRLVLQICDHNFKNIYVSVF